MLRNSNDASKKLNSEETATTVSTVDTEPDLQPLSRLLFGHLLLCREIENSDLLGTRLFELPDNALQEDRTKNKFMNTLLTDLERYLGKALQNGKTEELTGFIFESPLFDYVVRRFCSETFQSNFEDGVIVGEGYSLREYDTKRQRWPKLGSTDDIMAQEQEAVTSFSSTVVQISKWLGERTTVSNHLSIGKFGKLKIRRGWHMASQRIQLFQDTKLSPSSPVAAAVLSHDIYIELKREFFQRHIYTPIANARRTLQRSDSLRLINGELPVMLAELFRLEDVSLSRVGFIYGALKGSASRIYSTLATSCGISDYDTAQCLWTALYPRQNLLDEKFGDGVQLRRIQSALLQHQCKMLIAATQKDIDVLIEGYAILCLSNPWAIDERIHGPASLNRIVPFLLSTPNIPTRCAACTQYLSPMHAFLQLNHLSHRGVPYQSHEDIKEVLQATADQLRSGGDANTHADQLALRTATSILAKASEVKISYVSMLQNASVSEFAESGLEYSVRSAFERKGTLKKWSKISLTELLKLFKESPINGLEELL